jgi:ATP-dependent Lon protease
MEKTEKKAKGKRSPLLPLRDIVVFPHMIVPLFVGRAKSIKALEHAMLKEKHIFLASQKDARMDDPNPEDIYRFGVVAEILQILKLTDGTVKALVEGLSRAEIDSFHENDEFFQVDIIGKPESTDVTPEIEALMRSLNSLFEDYVKLNHKIAFEVITSVQNIIEPSKFADTIASNLTLKVSEKQRILETTHIKKRLELLSEIITSEIEILQIERKVRGRVKSQMEKSQREYYLTEQMKAIQKELGKDDEFTTEIEELREKIKKAKMPKEVNQKALKELNKLEMMAPMSAEATVVRNYIDWLIDLPWSKRTKEKLDIKEAEAILNEDHYGLEKVKERILEYLSVRKLVKKMKGPILCFVGPPGVGKTSLGKSIARATGRNFVRLSLGGVRDEAEIRGHRKTYIGALPGRIIQYLVKAKSKNPVFLLDEVDKMSSDFRGDPAAALLEVLDPEQNHSFNDHYLEVDFDLSEVLFITTANILYSIPSALQDRMEVLRLPGYTEHEKIKIAELFLIPKQLKAHGLETRNIAFPRKAIREVIQKYTREAGVRNLEREIANVFRKIAKKVASNGETDIMTITPKSLRKFLGVPQFSYGKAEEKSEIGIATGLAWTEVGGELLITEIILMDGKGKLILTGKLGDVMQESAQAALSYVRSKADLFELDKNFYKKKDIHIHVPEGAIPKDGPSAGITMAVALISALTKTPVRKDVAMTGEITLRGKVLPVGGIKEKILAAHRGGLKTIILPKENEKDLSEIPAEIKKSLKIVLVEKMEEVVEYALLEIKKTKGELKAEKGFRKTGNDKTDEKRVTTH